LGMGLPPCSTSRPRCPCQSVRIQISRSENRPFTSLIPSSLIVPLRLRAVPVGAPGVRRPLLPPANRPSRQPSTPSHTPTAPPDTHTRRHAPPDAPQGRLKFNHTHRNPPGCPPDFPGKPPDPCAVVSSTQAPLCALLPDLFHSARSQGLQIIGSSTAHIEFAPSGSTCPTTCFGEHATRGSKSLGNTPEPFGRGENVHVGDIGIGAGER